MSKLDPGVQEDLSTGSNGGSGGALKELREMHSEGGGNMPDKVKYGIYAALIIAILQIYVGFEVPNGTFLVLVALGFLGLGLWAGMRMHEQLERVAEAFDEWRSSKEE